MMGGGVEKELRGEIGEGRLRDKMKMDDGRGMN